jgi:acetylcholinesterase
MRQFGPICYHAGGDESEDCLYINVWTPADATPNSKLPVWFYVQGGGYEANTNANYNGTKVIKESGGNVIFVGFNYRVGVFGFLAGESLRNDGDLNVGLLDQRKALEWVQKYISLVCLFHLNFSQYCSARKLFLNSTLCCG